MLYFCFILKQIIINLFIVKWYSIIISMMQHFNLDISNLSPLRQIFGRTLASFRPTVTCDEEERKWHTAPDKSWSSLRFKRWGSRFLRSSFDKMNDSERAIFSYKCAYLYQVYRNAYSPHQAEGQKRKTLQLLERNHSQIINPVFSNCSELTAFCLQSKLLTCRLMYMLESMTLEEWGEIDLCLTERN